MPSSITVVVKDDVPVVARSSGEVVPKWAVEVEERVTSEGMVKSPIDSSPSSEAIATHYAGQLRLITCVSYWLYDELCW